jgi:hypothetical protein
MRMPAPPPQVAWEPAERCDPPRCVRPIGHCGECRPTWHRREVCGVQTSRMRAPCARRPGHGWDHRSASLLARDNVRNSLVNR